MRFFIDDQKFSIIWALNLPGSLIFLQCSGKRFQCDKVRTKKEFENVLFLMVISLTSWYLVDELVFDLVHDL